LKKIFAEIINGVDELHSIGYVHRDLKPENIVLNLEPLEVKIIDFDMAMPDSEATKNTTRGTPGYFPLAETWTNGDYKWDMWSLAVMICEADMAKDAYVHINDEKQAKQKIRAHLKQKSTHENLKTILD
jgi:serine/threonine protein kinase